MRMHISICVVVDVVGLEARSTFYQAFVVGATAMTVEGSFLVVEKLTQKPVQLYIPLFSINIFFACTNCGSAAVLLAHRMIDGHVGSYHWSFCSEVPSYRLTPCERRKQNAT